MVQQALGMIPSMESHVRTLLMGVGEDVDREGLKDTPKVHCTGSGCFAAAPHCAGPPQASHVSLCSRSVWPRHSLT